MIDNILLYVKLFPSLIKYTKQRIKDTWKWFAILFGVQLIILALSVGVVSFSEIEDVVKARWLYKLSALVTFITIIATIYKSYKEYSQDYLVTKAFQSSPIITTIANAIIGSIIVTILTMIISLFKPINFETSILATLFFTLMIILFMIFISVMVGLLNIISSRVTKIYFIISFICFFLLPIIYIPATKDNILGQLLKLNPVYYIVDGSASSTIYGMVNLYNITYHIYFIVFLVIIGTTNFMIMRYVAHTKYKYSSISINEKH